MGTQGRKNVHGKGGVRFKEAYTSSKEKAMQRNVVSELIVHGRVVVTSGVVKTLKRNADRLITLAKRGDLHAIRLAASRIRNIKVDEKTTALDKLFKELGPKFKDRNGGYTRAIKMQARRGDNATMVIVEWVE